MASARPAPTSASAVGSSTATTATTTTPSSKKGTTIDSLTAAAQKFGLSSVAGDEDDDVRLLGGLQVEQAKSLILGSPRTSEKAVGEASDGTTQVPSLQDWLQSRTRRLGGEAIMMIGRRRKRSNEVEEGNSSAKDAPKSSESSSRNGMGSGKGSIEPGSIIAAPEGTIHVDDDFTKEQMQQAIATVAAAAGETEIDMTNILEGDNEEPTGTSWCFLLLRRRPSNAQELLELRIAVVGNVDAGKSSTLGVLTRGGLDDGRGKARVNLFRHKHEIESGRTSSVGMEIMGFDTKGNIVMNYDPKRPEEPGRKMTWEEICEKSAKVLTFIDLAGHERYLKTTVGGLTGCLPDYVMLMVGANAGLIGMSKEHLGVALALAVPVLVCITKVDMTPPHILEATVKQLTKILRSPGCRKTPIFVANKQQAIDSAMRLSHERICPIFQISNVTGMNLELVRGFLNVLPQADPAKFSLEAPFKFQLQDVFSVPFVGCVVSGVVLSGAVRIGDNLVIGPDSLGQFTNTSVRSIQRKRVNVDAATAGQSASFALKRIRRNQVRKGMVMMSKAADGQPPPRAVMTCDAEVLCLYHSTTLSVGSCMVLHAASIRQTVRITQIAKLDSDGNIVSSTWNEKYGDNFKGKQQHARAEAQSNGSGSGSTASGAPIVEKPVVRTGDRALLRLQFIRTAEYVEPGLKLITREGKTKLIGVVRAVGQSGPLSTEAGTNAGASAGAAGTSSAAAGSSGGAASTPTANTAGAGHSRSPSTAAAA